MKSLLRPFAALRPRKDAAGSVVAPPYDVIDTDEARELAAGLPNSFLHISRPEIDLPPGASPYSDEAYALGVANLNRLIAAGILEREKSECYYVYRMRDGQHVQTGIAAVASLEAYRSGHIHAHESTRPDKENDRVRNIDTLNAQTGPVLLTYKANGNVDDLLTSVTAKEPLLEAIGQHDVLHTIWRISDAATIEALTVAFDAIGDLYIADGHHRSAAAARVAEARSKRDGGSAAACDYFLSVAFPDDQMQIFDYNRTVADLNGLTIDGFIAAISETFDVRQEDQACRPRKPRTFGLFVDGHWYRLELRDGLDLADPVARLDVSILQQHLIAPILGITDPRTDPRIGFVGGVRGLGELEKRVNTGAAAAAFALYPTSIRQLMDVADAGRLMPPKSTWFEPKLADGLLSHML